MRVKWNNDRTQEWSGEVVGVTNGGGGNYFIILLDDGNFTSKFVEDVTLAGTRVKRVEASAPPSKPRKSTQ
jgi:hypothetical protein